MAMLIDFALVSTMRVAEICRITFEESELRAADDYHPQSQSSLAENRQKPSCAAVAGGDADRSGAAGSEWRQRSDSSLSVGICVELVVQYNATAKSG